MRKSSEIRAEFIDFFKKRGHTFVPSAPIIPKGDPTLLFVNAGMVQFKDVFLGTGTRDYRRAVNSQKCIRVSGKHNDLESVGRDTYHHTFFEMLGNWSFGDYGKEETIAWAWELLTRVWGLPIDRLYATVHLEDDEAEEIWSRNTDLGRDRIFRFDKDNFWEMGDIGPCGPSSEIHIDLGHDPGGIALAADPHTGLNSGSDRFVELWNLVFIRYERLPDGSLIPLKQMHVDTGMGFERICSVLQGKSSNFETDIFLPLLERISEISGANYEPGLKGTPHRVIADHIRMLTFALADGVICSNEGRGYVARRILRRAARFGRELGVHEPFLYRLVSTVVDTMGTMYPEIVKRSPNIAQAIKAEEESFGVTLDRGLELFANVAGKVLDRGENTIAGQDAFKLYDTYGFPLDLTVLLAREKGLKVDENSFGSCMQRQKDQSRAEGKFASRSAVREWTGQLAEGSRSVFTGYDCLEVDSAVLGLDEKTVILDRTPFYPEGGGQVADQGFIHGPDFTFRVRDVRRLGSLILHEGEFEKGGPPIEASGTTVKAAVEKERRLATARNHTATHLLHRVLHEELGEAATQAGSLVSPDYLRFDFHHYEKVSEEMLLTIEKRVNAEIRANRPVKTAEMDYDEAVAGGAIALFGEKYEKRVRVIEVELFSKELCGGTHVHDTGQIGAFVIVSESSVAAGVRRIEAYTGERAAAWLLERSRLLAELEHIFSAKPEGMLEKANEFLDNQKTLTKELSRAKENLQRYEIEELLKGNLDLPGNIRLLTRFIADVDMEYLKGLGDAFREKGSSRGVALFATEKDNKILFVCVVTDELVNEGKLKAGDLISKIAKLAGGGGGGKPHLATAAGKFTNKRNEILTAFERIVEETLTKGSVK